MTFAVTCVDKPHVSGLTIVVDGILDDFDIGSAARTGAVVKKATGEKIPNNLMRFVCYKMFIAEKYCHLGHGYRI